MYRKISCSLSLAVACAGCVTTTSSRPGASNNISQPTADAGEVKPDAPLTANTHFAAGQVAESQGDAQRAILQYEQACKLDHTASVPLLRLGMIYTQLGQFNQAVDAWNRYIKATKGDASGYCNLGYTFELSQKFGEAEKAYQTAIARNPKNETAHVNYGLMLAREGQLDAAATQLEAVLTPAEVHYDLASVLESQGKKEAARDEYQEALKLNPQMTDAQARLAAIDIN